MPWRRDHGFNLKGRLRPNGGASDDSLTGSRTCLAGGPISFQLRQPLHDLQVIKRAMRRSPVSSLRFCKTVCSQEITALTSINIPAIEGNPAASTDSIERPTGPEVPDRKSV